MVPKSILRAFMRNYSHLNIISSLNSAPKFHNAPLVIARRNLSQNVSDAKKDDKNFHRHCFHDESEKALNEQIEAELNACYAYLAMASHFGRSDVAFPGCYAFFFQMHLEELGHAHNLIRYQNMRGGKVLLCGLKAVEDCNLSILQSFEKGLQMEKEVKEKLVSVTHVAEKHKDFSLSDFLVSDYIQAQEKSIQEYARLLQRYKSMSACGNCQCTDFLFDKELHAEFSNGKNHDVLKFTDDEKAFK